MFTTAYCLVVGLWLRLELGFYLVSDWSVVMHVCDFDCHCHTASCPTTWRRRVFKLISLKPLHPSIRRRGRACEVTKTRSCAETQASIIARIRSSVYDWQLITVVLSETCLLKRHVSY